MDTTPFIDAIRGDLQAVTAGDESAAGVAERLSRALESSLHLRLLDAMGEAALELSDQLRSGHVEVRLAGRDVQLVLIDAVAPEPGPMVRDDEGGTARLTLRMPDALKGRVEEAAVSEGVSTNAWLVRAIGRGLESPPSAKRRVGSRITGFAQS
ncbi:MAG: hypothetical protein ABI572_00465 [Actinomycetota bacterium]